MLLSDRPLVTRVVLVSGSTIQIAPVRVLHADEKGGSQLDAFLLGPIPSDLSSYSL